MLDERKKELLDWYDNLSPEDLVEVNRWLETGDASILLTLRDRSNDLKRFDYMSFIKRPEKLSTEG